MIKQNVAKRYVNYYHFCLYASTAGHMSPPENANSPSPKRVSNIVMSVDSIALIILLLTVHCKVK